MFLVAGQAFLCVEEAVAVRAVADEQDGLVGLAQAVESTPAPRGLVASAKKQRACRIPVFFARFLRRDCGAYLDRILLDLESAPC